MPSRNAPPALRWARRLASGIVLLLLIAVVVAVVGWLVAGEFLATQGALIAGRAILGEDTRLSAAKVTGVPLYRLQLQDVRLERQGPEGWQPVASARQVAARFDLWGILHRRYVLPRVWIDGLELDLRATEGNYVLPRFRSGKKGGTEGDTEGGKAGPPVVVKQLLLTDAAVRVDVPWRTLEAESLGARVRVTSRNGAFTFDVDSLRAVFADSIPPLHLTGGTVEVFRGVRFDDLRGLWGETPINADGRIGGEDTDLSLRLGAMPLTHLGTLFQEDGFEPGHVDRFEGRMRTDGGAVRFDWSLAGGWEGWTTRGLTGQGRLADDVLRLSGIEGEANGAAVADGSVRIPIKEETLAADVSFTGARLEDLPLVEELRRLPSRLAGRARLVVPDRTRIEEDYEIRLDLGAGEILEVPFRTARLGLLITNEDVYVDSAHVDLEAAVLEGGGALGDTLDAVFRYGGDLAPWRVFLRQDVLHGTGDLEVRLWGPLSEAWLTATGYVSRLEVGNIRAPRVEIEHLEGPVTGARRLAISFAVRQGLTLGSVPFTEGRGRLLVREQDLEVEELTLTRGDSLLTATGRVRWDPRMEIYIEEARARLDGREFWTNEPCRLIWEDGTLSSEQASIQTKRGRLDVQGRWNPESGDLRASFHLENLDPSVFFPPDRPPAVRIGSMKGDLELSGRLPSLDGAADLRLLSVEWANGRLDSLRATLTAVGSGLHVERLETALGRGRASLEGNIVLPAPVYETLEALMLGPDPDPETVRWDLRGRCTSLDLNEWLSFLPRKRRPSGWVDAAFTLGGTFADPRAQVTGRLRQIVWPRLLGQETFLADTLVVRGKLEEQLLTLDPLTLWQHGWNLEAQGTLPLSVTVYPFAWELPERNIDLHVYTASGSLESLALTPWVDEAEGGLEAELRIGGTPRYPLMQGWARTRDGRIRPADREEVLENVRVRLRFDGSLVTIEEAEADMGGGTVRASGTYRLHAGETETYEVQVHADQAVVRGKGVYAARASGDIRVVPRRAANGVIFPFATGHLDVHRAEYAGTLKPQDIAQFKLPSLLYDVTITAPGKLFIVTDEANAELGGEVTMQQTPTSRIVLGELEIIRGWYKVFLERFRIIEGRLWWTDPETLIPEMDVTAETLQGGYLITVNVTGRADAPALTFGAESLEGTSVELSQDDIVLLLAQGAVGLSGQLPGQGEGTANRGALEEGLSVGTSLLGGPIERELMRRLGIDEFQISTGTGTNEELGAEVSLRKWLSPELSFIVRQGLGRTFDQDLAVEYRLRRALLVRGGMRNKQEGPSSTVNQVYNLDLRLRHEY